MSTKAHVPLIRSAPRVKGSDSDRLVNLKQIEDWPTRSGKYDRFFIEDVGLAHSRRRRCPASWGSASITERTPFVRRMIASIPATRNWEQDALEACADHVAHNDHASKRIKQKTMNRFKKFGGAPARPVYGYIVPPGAKTYDEWLKDETASPKIQAAARILLESLNCTYTANWMNEQGTPVGPYCRVAEWDGGMVRRYFQNPILKGLPTRGDKHTVKHHESGRRVSVNNPDGPSFYSAPHLAHIDAVQLDALNAILDEKNGDFRRRRDQGVDSRSGVPRKQTRFPGQHAQCWYCGRPYVWGGNGITAHLMCNGSRALQCWNSVGFDGALAAKKLVAAICDQLHSLDGFDAQFAGILEATREEALSLNDHGWTTLCRDEEMLGKEIRNCQDTIAAFGPQHIVGEQLKESLRAETARFASDHST